MKQETEREIWERVRQTGTVTAEEALLPERLEGMILEQSMNGGALRALAGRVNGPERSVLRQMASDQENQVREMTTLHYLLTGRRLRLRPAADPLPESLPEALRKLYFRLRQASRDYQNLAREFSDYGELFQRMAAEEGRHSSLIRQILRGRLQMG